MHRYILILSFLLVAGVSHAAEGIFKAQVSATMDETYKAVYKALEDERFWVVFEANIGENLKGFSKRWGEDYNRSGLQGIRSMVICNGWYANKVSNADPDLLALCPLRVNLVHKDGITRVLFARPTVVAGNSPGLEVIREVEELVIKAIGQGVASVRK